MRLKEHLQTRSWRALLSFLVALSVGGCTIGSSTTLSVTPVGEPDAGSVDAGLFDDGAIEPVKDIKDAGVSPPPVPEGFVHRTLGDAHYLFSLEYGERDWSAAKDACESFGYELISPTDVEEVSWLHEQVRDDLLRYDPYPLWGEQNSWWVGLVQASDMDSPAKGWSWLRGDFPIEWERYEPNDFRDQFGLGGIENGDEDCGAFNYRGDGLFNDDDCEYKMRFVCKWHPLFVR